MARLGLFNVQRAAASRNKPIKTLLMVSCFAVFVCIQQIDFLQLINLRVLIRVDDDLTDLTVVPKICPPTKSFHTEYCPKVACVPTRSAGLGHRVHNVLQGSILAQSLGLPMAGPRLEYPNEARQDYSGANRLFHNDNEIVECPLRNRRATHRWKKREFYADGRLGRIIHFGDNATTSVNTLPFGHPNHRFTWWEEDGCSALERARKVVEDAPCFSIFMVNEFWPLTHLAGYEELRALYKGFEPEVRDSLLTKNLIDERKFNLAFHIRDGDIVSNTKEYFNGILSTILREISTLKVEVKVLVFSEHVEKYLEDIKAIANSSKLDVEVVDGGDLSPVETFIHFLSAHVFVGSDSSFSSSANIIAGGSMRPVVIASPNRVGDLESNYVPGNLIGTTDGVYTDYGTIFDVARKWKRNKKSGASQLSFW